MNLPSVLMIAGLVLACLPARAEWLADERGIMGTSVRVELWHEDPARGRAAITAVMDEMHRIDALMSVYKPDSEISMVNRDAAGAPVAVSRELYDLVKQSLQMSELTGGAFDISYASVGHLYDFRHRERPGEADIAEALPRIDYRLVRLDPGQPSIAYLADGVRIDLGGIAKGYAVERGAGILRRLGIDHAIVTAGGDSRILGDRLGKPWMIGVRHPRDKQRVLVRLPLVDEAISTSGDYERYFDEDGVRFHHIINPGTGRSAGEVRSVTIIGPDAIMTDGLSTSVFVLGVEGGMALIDRLPDYEAVIADMDGRLLYSSGLARPD